MGRGAMKVYAAGEQPARLQTRTGWVNLGWRVSQHAQPADAELKSPYRRGFYALYDYTSVESIPGRRALERRIEFMLVYAAAVVRRHGEAWMLGHALVGLVTDEEIQDAAVYDQRQHLRDVFFADQVATIPARRLDDNLRLAFELGALEGQGRGYGDYRYNEF